MRRLVASCLTLSIIAALSACSKETTSAGAPAEPPAASAGADSGSEPSPSATNPFVLACSVNADGRQSVVRGWPALIRVSAGFDRDPEADESYALDDSALRLSVSDSDGAKQAWSLEGASTSKPVLDAEHPEAEVVRVLPAAATSELALGAYSFQVSWGPARDDFEVTVEDPPSASPEADEARVLLEADALALLGKLDDALDALDVALDAQPDSITLLTQRALVRESAGDDEGALLDAQSALQAFMDQYPDASEPPMTILPISQRLTERLLGGGEP